MPFIRTTQGTDWVKPSGWLARLISSIDTANPSYRGRYHLVRAWVIEFDERGVPYREVGLDSNGSPVLAGPRQRDYGFWLDTGMHYGDFVGDPVTQEDFETLWSAASASTL